MSDTWIIDTRNYLDDRGRLLELPTRVLNLALFQGSIVAWVTSRAADRSSRTNVYCRRSPGRRRCSGEIQALLDPSSARIVWECPLCGDNGLIHGWKGTIWDRRAPIPAIEDAGVDLAEDADGEALPVSPAHRAELDRRLHDLEVHPEAGSSWDEVRSRLERRRADGAGVPLTFRRRRS